MQTDTATTPSAPDGSLSVRPTRYGYIFVAVLAAMLLGSMNYNNNLGFLLTFLLSGMAAVSFFHTYRNVATLQVLSARAAPVFSGQPAVFECRVCTEKHPAAAVRLAFEGGRAEPADFEAGSETVIRIGVGTARRGILRPGPVTVGSRYPFGILQARKRFSLDAGVLVYPHPIRGAFETAEGPDAPGPFGKRKVPGVDDFQGLKSYQPGDRLQHISWKAFSRGQGLFTKQFSGEAGTSEMLDWDNLSERDPERKLSRLCDMVVRADQQRLSFGLRIPGRTIKPNRGQAHRKNCLKALAMFGEP